MWIPWQKWGRTKASHGLGSQNVARSSTCKTLVIHQKRRSERTPPQPLSQAFAFFTSNTALGLNHLNFPRPFMFVEDLYMGMGRFQACSPDQCTMDKQRRRFVHPVGRRVGLLVLTHWHNMICRHQLYASCQTNQTSLTGAARVRFGTIWESVIPCQFLSTWFPRRSSHLHTGHTDTESSARVHQGVKAPRPWRSPSDRSFQLRRSGQKGVLPEHRSGKEDKRGR